MDKKQPEAQERKFWKRLCALNRFSFFYMGGGVARASDKSGNWIEVHSAQEIVDDAECEVSTQHARITELEAQLAQRFDAADMATASAQGFRDGGASLTVQAADSQPAQVMGDTPPPCDQELFDQGVSVGLFDIPKWTAEALCRGIAAATEARVDWHYIGGRVHIKALPAARATAAQPGVVYAELPAPNYPKSGGFPGTFAEAQMRVFADATHALRASHGQAPAQPDQPIACSYGDNGYACCEGGPCQADVHNDKLAEQQPTTTAQAAGSVPAVEREQERIAFKDAHRHLELYEVPDAWGRPMFKHYFIEARWLGWIARASRGQAPSQAGEYPALVCDYCGALTPDPWHSSGMLHGKMSKHIHSCDACASHGQAPAKPDPAYSAACHLATALFKKHFAHLPDFASGQAVWSLCDSTAGVISQIDNMVAGLVQPPTISPQPVAREPLTPERVKEIVRGAGYDQCGIPDTERAAFINGLRHGEQAHGIKVGQHGTE